jgi:hypothetical protein
MLKIVSLISHEAPLKVDFMDVNPITIKVSHIVKNSSILIAIIWVVVKLSTKCSSFVNFILFRTRAKLKLIIELDNLFRLD